MFKSTKRLLIAATAIVAMSAPTTAYAFIPDPGGGSSLSGQAQSSITQLPTAAQLRQLDPLQARAHSQGGFAWSDVGIGAAGVLALVGIGGAATLVIRRRVHHPLAS
jgi:hypothetical protein